MNNPVDQPKVSELIERLARNFAVAFVDGRHGFTMEFAPSPAAHRDEYDEAESYARIVLETEFKMNPEFAALTPQATTVGVKALEWIEDWGQNFKGAVLRHVVGKGLTGDYMLRPDATDIRRSTPQEDHLNAELQAEFNRAEAAERKAAAPTSGAEKGADGNDEVDGFKSFLIAKSADPASGISMTERALYALLSLPKAAQALCTEDERETVIRTVEAAIRAAAPTNGAEMGKPVAGASDRIGAWLSAALEDPGVAPEMKADINAWFDAGQPLYAAPTSERVQALPKTEEYLLRAMAANYGDGPHSWDFLDKEACQRAADEIKSLRLALNHKSS